MSNGYKKGPYSPIQWALSSSVGFFDTQCAHTSCNPGGPGQFCELPSEWQCQRMNVSVHPASCVVDLLGAQVTTYQHLSCHCWKPCTVSACFHGITHTPYTFTNWHWIFTGATHTQKSKHTSYFKVCHGSRSSSIFNLTYLWYPLIAVQWHNLDVPITWLNLQSHDTVSCQTCRYLIFWNFLVYLSEVENSKYGRRNTSTTGSTTGMNTDMPLILNINQAVGVTEEVYIQR